MRIHQAAEQTHATWAGGDLVGTVMVDGVERPVIQMPYPAYSEPMERLLELIDELGLVVPFDWMGWDCLDRYRGKYPLHLVFAIARRMR